MHILPGTSPRSKSVDSAVCLRFALKGNDNIEGLMSTFSLFACLHCPYSKVPIPWLVIEFPSCPKEPFRLLCIFVYA